MNPIKSLIAKHQNKVLKIFPKTKFAKNIKRFHNIHKGERCFILGNGPSLTPEDLNALSANGEITFAMNRIFKIFPKTNWRPTYYFCEDELIASGCLDEMNAVSAKEKFIPLCINYYHDVKIKGANYFNLVYDKDIERYTENFDASVGVPCMGTVTTTCIFFAVYMGFKEIYLLGVDHNFKITIADDGSTVTDNSVKDYFCDNYDKDVQDKVTHDLRNTTKSYMFMKKFCEDNSVIIQNATRGGKLEVFPRVSMDELLKKEF